MKQLGRQKCGIWAKRNIFKDNYEINQKIKNASNDCIALIKIFKIKEKQLRYIEFCCDGTAYYLKNFETTMLLTIEKQKD